MNSLNTIKRIINTTCKIQASQPGQRFTTKAYQRLAYTYTQHFSLVPQACVWSQCFHQKAAGITLSICRRSVLRYMPHNLKYYCRAFSSRLCKAIVSNETHDMLIVCFHNKTKNAAFQPFIQETITKKSRQNQQLEYKPKCTRFGRVCPDTNSVSILVASVVHFTVLQVSYHKLMFSQLSSPIK